MPPLRQLDHATITTTPPTRTTITLFATRPSTRLSASVTANGDSDDNPNNDNGMPPLALTPTTTPTTTTTQFPVFLTIPPGLAVASFFTYPMVAQSFRALVDVANAHHFAPVDGGQLQSDLLLPVLNGPLLGACSILFATLTAMTIGNLYNRQLAIREALSSEVEELRQLALYIAHLPHASSAQMEATQYLEQHVDGLLQYDALVSIAEDASMVQDNSNAMIRSSFAIRQAGMDPLTQVLNGLLYSNEDNIPAALIGQMYDSTIRINTFRGQVISALQTRLPAVHYWILTSLAAFIAVIFLMETAGRDVLLFLADFQVRFMWTMLITVFTLIGCVVYDLESPFTGTYIIFSSSRPNERAVRAYVLGPIVEAAAATANRNQTTGSVAVGLENKKKKTQTN
ncbi:hypothetical protein ACA910_010989 [Epithemia clementina (nom. ined.)]